MNNPSLYIYLMTFPILFLFILFGININKHSNEEDLFLAFNTKASKSSVESYKYANKKLGTALILIAIISLIFASCGFFFKQPIQNSIFIFAPFIPIFLLLLRMITLELNIKKKFNLNFKSTSKFALAIVFAVISFLLPLLLVLATL
ncbi:hypothetical protein [uncultured Clostridium sp.]|uniref:hypothetical protein n=1 Tax=uncultured Clostridium sp. TaxID=59620 RepID=UPI00261C887E|nr:hypothetical protein [uncultured Clostridium sp.]